MTDRHPPIIDPAVDVLIPVSKMVRDRMGKRLSPSTLHRWIRRGVRGVVLPAVNVGGTWHTTRACWTWWVEAQSQVAMAPRSGRKAVVGVDDAILESAGLL